MRRPMIRAGLHAQFVTLGERIPPETLRLPATLLRVRIQRRRRLGRAFIFVTVAIALIDLDHRLDFRVVVAPVGALVRRRRMRHGDAVVPLQILIELGGADAAGSLVRRDRQWPRTAVSEDRISMAVRKSQTALRAIKRCECSRYLEQIDELLVLPPRELLVVSRLMIRERDVIEGRGVEPVTIAFKQR